MDFISAKEQDYINNVEEISKDMNLDHIPEVIFYDGFIPDQTSGVIACIDIYNHVIHVSRWHLRLMTPREIRNNVIHELNHYEHKGHDSDFNRDNIGARIGTWKPPSGVRVINGGAKIKKETTENENETVKITVDKRKIINNDPNEDWINGVEKTETDVNEQYERFYYKWKRRIALGENPDLASSDAPEGFRKWLKSNKKMIK